MCVCVWQARCAAKGVGSCTVHHHHPAQYCHLQPGSVGRHTELPVPVLLSLLLSPLLLQAHGRLVVAPSVRQLQCSTVTEKQLALGSEPVGWMGKLEMLPAPV